MFVLSPILLASLGIKIAFEPAWLSSKSKAYNIVVQLLLVIVVLYWIVRNIVGF